MIYGPDAAKCPIRKQVLNAGKEPPIEFCDEMKVRAGPDRLKPEFTPVLV